MIKNQDTSQSERRSSQLTMSSVNFSKRAKYDMVLSWSLSSLLLSEVDGFGLLLVPDSPV